MYTTGATLKKSGKSEILQFNQFSLNDRDLVQIYNDKFKPFSCEYNFSNLFAWQKSDKLFWTMYRERLLIYNDIEQAAFSPLGEDFHPHELAVLSNQLKENGLQPDFNMVPYDYLKKFPEIKEYYIIEKDRDSAEYIYDVGSLCELSGSKLHKKRNLISQFKRSCPDFEVRLLKGEYLQKAFGLAQKLMNRQKINSKTLDQEFSAIKISFDCFEQLGLDGLVITFDEQVIAFSVFSELSNYTYDIQFEKADTNFKGAAQLINQETAIYLKNKCQYLNREQDLGIKGLRQAKMSYEPVKLITPYSLTFIE